jgi:GAF domain-containing protein/HAMP domain-containing protein
MNTSRLTFPLSFKFFIGVFLAVLIPTAVMLAISVETSNRINLLNLQAYIKENGLRRYETIQKSMDEITSTISEFVSKNLNRSILITSLQALNNTITTQEGFELISNRAKATLTDLTGDPRHFLDSAWLLTLDGRVVAPSLALNSRLPFTLQFANEAQSEVFRVAQSLDNIAEASAMVVTTRSGTTNLELVYLLKDARDETAGYLIADLDLNEIIFSQLANDNPEYELYSYVVMPDAINTLQMQDIRLKRWVYTNSVGVERAFGGQEPDVDSYVTGVNSDKTVIGFYAPINVLGTRFAFVTELDQGIMVTQRLNYIGQSAFSIVLVLLGLIVIVTFALTQIVTLPVDEIRRAMRGMMGGNYLIPVESKARGDEIGALAGTFVDMREQVSRLVNDMSQRLEDRTRDVRVTQDISRAAIAERNLQVLINTVVNLITESFPNIYHAQIFLIDSDKTFAVLRASTGQVGQELLKRGHRLAVGSVSVIGQVTEQGQVVIARDISASNVHRQNEFLRETQAELAIPLTLGTQIIGALDVQSKQRDSFTPEQITALQTLADQVTIAIENARLFEESQRLLSSLEVEKATRSRRAWQDYFNAQRNTKFSSRFGNSTGYDGTHLREAVLHSGESIVGEKTERNTIPFAIPIRLREQILGVVEYELQASDFSYNKVLLAEELMSRLAISLENARLFQDSVQSTNRERLVNEISAKLTSQTDIQDIINTAIREIGQALRTPQVAIRFQLNQTIDTANTNAPANTNGRNHRTTDEIPSVGELIKTLNTDSNEL